jgi:HEAT repeat protein
VVAGDWYAEVQPKLDISACLSALIAALKDPDGRVRGLAAQAIGEIGPRAALAVPNLVALLADPDEGSRNSACIGLAGIGPAARAALPALQRSLRDPSVDVRRFAQQAIDKIEAR